MLTTAVKGIPYPEDDDPIPSYPAITNALAQAVEDLLKLLPARVAVGTVDVTVTAAVTGNAGVTFPAGRFTTPPLFLAFPIAANVWMPYSANTPTTAGVTVGVRQINGTASTATVRLHWIALQFS